MFDCFSNAPISSFLGNIIHKEMTCVGGLKTQYSTVAQYYIILLIILVYFSRTTCYQVTYLSSGVESCSIPDTYATKKLYFLLQWKRS